MRPIWKVLLASAVIVCVALLGACSDDDDGGTGSDAKQPGNPTDLGYLLFKGVLFQFDDTTVDMIRDILEFYGMMSAKRTPSSDALSEITQEPVYHEDSEYWYYEHVDTSYYGIEYTADSLQFLHSGVAVQYPDSALLTEIRCGVHWVLVDTATEAKSHIDQSAPGDTLLTIDCLVTITGDPGQIAGLGDVTINLSGSVEGMPPGMSSDCDWNNDFDYVGTDLLINLTTDNCPTSGEIVYTGVMVLACPPPLPSYSNTWYARQTFDSGDVSWYIENENYYWEESGYCSWYLYF